MTIKTVNPYTEEVIKEYAPFSIGEIERRVSLAEERFSEWRTTSFEERRKKFSALAKVMDRKKRDLAVLATQEMGKTLLESISEVEKCIKGINYYVEHGEEFLSDQKVEDGDFKGRAVYEPLGVVVGVMPWNFPYWQVIRFSVPTIFAGNTVLLKHASNTLGCAHALEDLYKEAGFPEGVYQEMVVGHEAIDKLLSDPRVKAISLTGSTKAGRSIAELAGRYLKKSVLELGGSDPYIVLEDADVDLAVEKCAQTRMINNGQSCIAGKRFIVHQNIFEEFLVKMKHNFSQLKMGDPMNGDTKLGPLARKDLAEELMEQVDHAVSDGAKAHLENYPQEKGFFVGPQILTGIKPHQPTFKKELFGPVAMLFSFKTEDEALKIANGTPYGLGGGVFGKDIERIQHLARKGINSGCVVINDFVKSDPRLPFGGVKSSGYGRELGPYGLHEFVNLKSLNF